MPYMDTLYAVVSYWVDKKRQQLQWHRIRHMVYLVSYDEQGEY